MKAVCVQMDIAWEDKQANFEKVRRLLRCADVQPGSLIVLPEMFATGFSMNLATTAEDASRPTEAFLSELAQHYRSHVIAGLVVPCDDGLGGNEAVVFDHEGRLAARYRKMHPFTFGGESEHHVAGERPVVVACGEFQVAPFVCYDLRFPEIFRAAVVQGADLLVVIACWPQRRQSHWVALLRARAIENQAYVVGVNRTGRDPNHTYPGRSMVVDPMGETLADAGEDEGTIVAEIDHVSLETYRRDFPALADIRTEYRQARSR